MRSAQFIFFIFLLIKSNFAFAKNEMHIAYEMNSQIKWSRDLTTESPAAGNEHFTLTSDESIDLLFSFNDADFFSLIDKEGAQNFTTQILSGKNAVQKFVSDEPIRLKNVKISRSPERKTFSFESDYKFGEVQYHSFEKYFIFKNQTLHAVLRWNEKSNEAQLKLAKADFEKLIVKLARKK